MVAEEVGCRGISALEQFGTQARMDVSRAADGCTHSKSHERAQCGGEGGKHSKKMQAERT